MTEISSKVRELRELLDQHYPADLYSPEERFNSLVFLLKGQGLEVKLTDLIKDDNTKKRKQKDMHPITDVFNVLSGRTEVLRARSIEGGGEKVIESLFFEPETEVPQKKIILRAVFVDEYQRVQSDIKQRKMIDINELHRRGYQLAERWSPIPENSPANPKHISSFDELVEALKELRRAQGYPSLRRMAKDAEKPFYGPYGSTHINQPRSHATLGRVVKPGAKPELASVLAFVRGCRILGTTEAHEWAKAHKRAVLDHEEKNGN